MPPENLYAKNYFKALSILQIALIAGIVLFGAIISMLLLVIKRPVDEHLSNVFHYVVGGASIACILASKMVFKKKLNQIPADASLSSKMNAYRAALIVSYALLEGPALFAIVSTFVTGSFTLLIFAGIMVLLMLQARPTPQKAIIDMGLDDSERMTLEGPGSDY